MNENLNENNVTESENSIEENTIEEAAVGENESVVTKHEVEDINEESVPEQPVPHTLSENLTNDLYYGLHSVLFKRISNITINDKRLADAFSKFVKDVECGKSLSIIEILNAAEAVVKNKEPNENAGNHIYCYDHINIHDKSVSDMLLKNSVGGIYSLLAIRNGLYLDLDAIGGSIPAAEAKRYLIIPAKKANRFINIASRNVFNLIKAGEVLADNRIHYARRAEVIATVDKTVIQQENNFSITLGSEHYSAFLSGFNSVCSYTLCNCVVGNNLIRFGLGGTLSDVFARALGVFSALTYLKILPLRFVYTNENDTNIAVSRPEIADGDYLYLLKLRVDENGMPDKTHLGQLYYYLSEKKRLRIIKDVLPLRENINSVINRLCGDKMEYVSLSSVPENSFGIIVSVGRGESVNGLSLGYFKEIQ